ncbi:hypothetical protein HK096_008746 [Nowakowskiella sp. JEL0078]|nr:hypothetical protein HK096_008746 [Nowakowskiella sp. JEL0078]
MSKASTFFTALALFFIMWAFLLYFSMAASSPQWFADLVPVVPLWLLVTFGSYSLGNLGWALVTFRDCVDAHRELVAEIQFAKDDLRKNGLQL